MNSSLNPLIICPIEICGAVKNVQPLTLGMSGAAVFSVEAEKGNFVVRFHANAQSSWESSRDGYRLASDCGVAPKLLHVDESEKALLTTKIEGSSFGAALMNPSTRSQAFSSFVQRLKLMQRQSLSEVSSVDPVEAGRNIWSLQKSRPGFPSWASDFSKHIENAAQTLATDKRRVFSHGDLNPGNILWDGSQVWFVDWEQATMNHPYMDLATFSNFLSLPEEATLAITGAIENVSADGLTAHHLETLKIMKNYSRLAYGCVFLSMVDDLRNVDTNSQVSLSECFAQFAAGKLSLTSDSGRAAIGIAFLRQISE